MHTNIPRFRQTIYKLYCRCIQEIATNKKSNIKTATHRIAQNEIRNVAHLTKHLCSMFNAKNEIVVKALEPEKKKSSIKRESKVFDILAIRNSNQSDESFLFNPPLHISSSLSFLIPYFVNNINVFSLLFIFSRNYCFNNRL